MNPFLLKGYMNPSLFCDREDEKNKMIEAVVNQQDLTLFAYRRLGKSALIHHLFHELENTYRCIYVDIWGTTSLNDFIQTLANAVINSNVFTKRGITKKAQDFIRNIGASFSIGFDGNPSLKIDYNDKTRFFNTLEEIISFLEKSSLHVILAFDEFQEIRKYNESAPLEAKLRTLSQQSQNIRFIYSGSEQHLLNDIFNNYSMPFYQTTRMMALGKIERDTYQEFIIKLFKNSKKEIIPEIADHILSISYCHTYYVQAICNFIYSRNKKPKNISEFDIMYSEFISEKSVFYQELPERLTKQQFIAVKTFAKQGKVKSPTSSEFMEFSKIRSASSMQRVIKSLSEKQLLIKDEGSYRLYDVFLEHYLKYLR